MGLMLRQSMALALGGTALGLFGAFAVTRWLQALLFEVRRERPRDFYDDCFVVAGSGACSLLDTGATGYQGRSR